MKRWRYDRRVAIVKETHSVIIAVTSTGTNGEMFLFGRQLTYSKKGTTIPHKHSTRTVRHERPKIGATAQMFRFTLAPRFWRH